MPKDDTGHGLARTGFLPFAALALRLADLGYSPIPLDGKAAFLGGWARRHDPDPAWIEEQARAYPAHNLGVVCGRVVAVDIDVLDPELAHRLDALAVARLGDGPLRVGRWPKRLRVYRLAEPLRKLTAGAAKGAQVEVLAWGQQFAAYGTHPDTGRPYTWPDGNLTEWALDDLPEVSPEQLRRFVAEAEALLPRGEDAPARAKARSAAAGGGEVVRGADGRVVDGRDAYLSQLAFHAVHDAIARGSPLEEAALGAVVWDRFCDTAELGDAKGTGRAWSEQDARAKVRDKLRLHRAGALPRRGDQAAAAVVVEPFHPLPTGTAEDARAEVRRHVRGFLERALDHHAAPEGERGTPEHGALAVEVAGGKTSITLAELPGFVAAAKARGLPHRVLFLVPTHKLGTEILDALARLGLRAAPMRGREAADPDTGEAMCANLGAVRDAIALKLEVDKAVCGKAGGARCPFSGCPYQRQKAPAAAAEVVVAAHEAMLGRLTEAIGRGFGLVVADEGWWQDGVETGRVLAVETLRAGETAHPVPRRNDPNRRDDAATNDLHALRRKLAAAVEASPDGYLTRAALEGAKLTAADCVMARALEWRRKVEDAMRPGMAPEARREAAKRCAGNAAIPRLAALWKAARELLEGDAEATGRVELDTRDTAEGQRRVVLLNTARPVAEAVVALPMLLLDATLPKGLLRHRLPGLRVLATVRAKAPHMHLHQILGGFGKTSTVPNPEAPEAENRRRERRITALRRFVAARAGGARSLVITYKELEARLAGLPGVELAHFNAIAGRDEWGPGPDREGVRHLFVVGRPLPASGDVRRLAAALTGRPVARERPERVERGATMRDGTGAAVGAHAFADPDLEAVRAAITDAELVQAIGRGRGINRGEANPLDVWLLAGDAVVPLPVDELARWEDVAPKPGPRERMAELGVVLESPGDAARAYPDLFPTAGAAREALAREAMVSGQRRGDFRHIPLWKFSIGLRVGNQTAPPIGEWVGNPAWVQVAYRPPGRGQQTRTAWARPDRLPGLRAWLEAALGVELALFRSAVPEPPPKPPPTGPARPRPSALPRPAPPDSADDPVVLEPPFLGATSPENAVTRHPLAAPPALQRRLRDRGGGRDPAVQVTGLRWALARPAIPPAPAPTGPP